MRRLQTSRAPSPPPPHPPPSLCPLSVPPSLSSPPVSLHSLPSQTHVSQLLLSHRPTTCAINLIPSILLQAIAPDILPFITSLMNSSLSSGHFSSSFKKAYITPLLKKPTLVPFTIQNYRHSSHFFPKPLNVLPLTNSLPSFLRITCWTPTSLASDLATQQRLHFLLSKNPCRLLRQPPSPLS